MDSIFLLGEEDREAFLQQIMESFGCVYICLWSYSPPPSNVLMVLDGLYYGSVARQLFDEYRLSVYYVGTGRIPGLAFENSNPYMEVKLHDFQRLVSSQVQLQFYQEAGIKTVVFLGCASGEIELGMSSDPQVNLEMEIRNLIEITFSQQAATHHIDASQRPSSSSSSLRSLSVDDSSSELYPPLLYGINPPTSSSSFVQEAIIEGTLLEEALLRSSSSAAAPIITTIATSPHEQARQALNQMRNIQLPRIEREDAAMTKAILAVLSSSSPSSSQHTTPQNLPPMYPPPAQISHNPTAFTRYRPTSTIPLAAIPAHKHNKFKRSIMFFRNLNIMGQDPLNRPTAMQLNHVIAERRRREKQNQKFDVLRSLLPTAGTKKKDKASVLSRTTEYLSSLISQVAELTRKNQMLESQLSIRRSEDELARNIGVSSSSVERINVQIAEVSSSTISSEARFLDLRVTLRSRETNLLNLLIRLMDFLKQLKNVSLLSIESNTHGVSDDDSGSIPVHGAVLRLKIEGDDFDESGFQEAVRRVVDDQAH